MVVTVPRRSRPCNKTGTAVISLLLSRTRTWLHTTPVSCCTRLTRWTCAPWRLAPRTALPSTACPCQAVASAADGGAVRSAATVARRASKAATSMARSARRKVEVLGTARGGRASWLRSSSACSATHWPIARPLRCPQTSAALISVSRSAQGWRLPRALRGSGTSATASIRVLYLQRSITHHPLYLVVKAIVGDGYPHGYNFDTALGHGEHLLDS